MRRAVTFLTAASELLSSSLDPDTTLQNPPTWRWRLGDWCAIDLADEEEGLRNVAAARRPRPGPVGERVSGSATQSTRCPGAPNGSDRQVEPTRDPDELLVEAAGRGAPEGDARDRTRLEHVVPLGARGRGAGRDHSRVVLAGPPFDQTDLELVETRAARRPRRRQRHAVRHEHDAAVTLQRTAAAQSLPSPGCSSRRATCRPRQDWRSVAPGTTSRPRRWAAMTIGDIGAA